MGCMGYLYWYPNANHNKFSQSNAIYTPTASRTPTSSPSPTPAVIEGCVLVTNLRARTGPGIQYQTTKSLVSGECIQLTERNEESDWGKYADGWVSTEFLSLDGELKNLPVTTYPELTATPP